MVRIGLSLSLKLVGVLREANHLVPGSAQSGHVCRRQVRDNSSSKGLLQRHGTEERRPRDCQSPWLSPVLSGLYHFSSFYL